MLEQYLRNENFPVAKFNAWESDYASDPFVAISSELTEALREYDDESTKQAVENALKNAKEVLRHAGPAILRGLLAQLPGVGSVAGDALDGIIAACVEDRLSAYTRAKESVRAFKSALSKMAQAVSTSREEDPFPLVLMIDELDRCRPSYAVELLEVAKHLFSVERIVFVLALNRAELAHSIQAAYGNDFDARGYLGRFFDIDFRLPDPDRSGFIKASIESVGIGDYLRRTRDREGASEFSTLETLLDSFFGESSVSLRTVARAIHHLGLVYASLADDQKVLGTTSAVLLILRTIDRDLYYRFVGGQASDLEVVDSVYQGLVIEAQTERERAVCAFDAWIIFAQVERDQSDRLVTGEPFTTPLMLRCDAVVADANSDGGSSSSQRVKRAREVLRIVDVINRQSDFYRGINFNAAVQRIELLSPDLGNRDSAMGANSQ